ncbi:GtrA family protein [Burkholderia territorii]|uniref:GtrA family protein n=1 Tax=Burkholderia territorii TaxID=1503055 RepID=UPI00075DD68E|nr:GtrA family protein [Burkholderia territorii]KWE35178.1 polysaccharide synthesis protein GtrA [Burkholderia territorii]KWE36500.1 polysaccharide synthesis protein GtrA [Burkholderia territorii]KWE53703.1 polysaccharide synthesis protein GtrA [Burkholderia territorii]KWH05712.1 polysaccharide synthesis protein GtrA [Burkholderia territorii]
MMFSGYFIVSAVSLIVDWALFLALTSATQIDAGISASAAYLAGGGVNYVLSRRFVFRSTTAGRERVREALLFAASCGFGSLLTAGIVHLAAGLLGNIASKWLAVTVSFITLYLVRSIAVFRVRAARPLAALPATGRRKVAADACVEATVR